MISPVGNDSQHPQKRSRGHQLIHRRLSKTKSIDSGLDHVNEDIKSLGTVHKGSSQKNLFVPPPLSAFYQPPLADAAFSIIHCSIWSDSEIAGALKICCSLISSSGHFLLSGSLALEALLIGVHCKKRYINL